MALPGAVDVWMNFSDVKTFMANFHGEIVPTHRKFDQKIHRILAFCSPFRAIGR